MMNIEEMKRIVEGALLAAGEPLSVDNLQKIFLPEPPAAKEIKEIIQLVAQDYESRAIELKEVASGYRFQVRADLSPWIGKMWEEKPPRYSRALLETLAMVAYRQPITRAEIEEVRGVAVSSHIIKTLLDRDWVKIVGHREVPGKPALYATTKQFLDDMSLQSLAQLPTLEEIKQLEESEQQLALELNLEIPSVEAASVAESAEINAAAEIHEEENSAETGAVETEITEHEAEQILAEESPEERAEESIEAEITEHDSDEIELAADEEEIEAIEEDSVENIAEEIISMEDENIEDENFAAENTEKNNERAVAEEVN